MRYVIDACNLIFQDRRLEETLDTQGFQAARALLVRMLSGYAKVEGLEQIVAVFDGSEKGAHRPRRSNEAEGKVMLVYADPRTDADRYIIEMVEDAKRPGEMTVVTSDKFIIRHTVRSSAHHLECRAFLRQMRGAARRDPFQGEHPGKFAGQLTPREIEEWMEYFGFEDDDADADS